MAEFRRISNVEGSEAKHVGMVEGRHRTSLLAHVRTRLLERSSTPIHSDSPTRSALAKTALFDEKIWSTRFSEGGRPNWRMADANGW